MLPLTLLGFATMRRENGFVLFVGSQRHCITAVGLQPLVEFVLIEHPSLARLGGGERAVGKFHVQCTKWYARVRSRLINRHRLVAFLTVQMSLAFVLLSGQQGLHAHHLIPKLGNDLRKVVKSQFLIIHCNYGLWIEDRRKGTQ